MAWGPPTTKEDMIKTADELSAIPILSTMSHWDSFSKLHETIGKLRSQINHIPWEEVDHDNP